MKVETITVGAIQSNCFIIRSDASHEALVIDPGDEAPSILRAIRDNDLTIAAYLLTHGHFDHVSALADVYDEYPAPIAMHPLDRKWAFTGANAMPPYYSTPREPSEIARVLGGGQTWTDAGLRYEVIETPGHSPGSVSFFFADAGRLFSGDVLFAGSVGRTDIPGGDSRVLAQSLRILTKLPDSTIVYPGHGPETTIGAEKKSNPFIRNWTDR